MIKQNKVKLWNCSPTYQAYYKGINYGMRSDMKLANVLKLDGNFNTITSDDLKDTNPVFNYLWSEVSPNEPNIWSPCDIEIYMHSDDELDPTFDYIHFRGMTKDGIIAGQYAISAKVEISPDKHDIKISFPDYYGVAGIWINRGMPDNITIIFLNKLCNKDPDEWMKGYFNYLNTITEGTLSLGTGWLSRISDSTKKIATDKGWILS